MRLRGVHIGELARAGLVTVAPVAAAANPTGKRNSKSRKEKKGKAGTFMHTRPDAVECMHELWYDGGQLCEERLDAAGKKILVSLGDARVLDRPNKTDHRMYHEWDLYCAAGQPFSGAPTKVGIARWAITDTDAGFNVAENLRAYAPGGPGYLNTTDGAKRSRTTTTNPTPARSNAAAAAPPQNGTSSTKSAGRS